MEEQPSFEPQQSREGSAQRRVPDFVRRLGRILVVSFIGAALYALIFGPRNTGGLANGLFLIGAFLLLVSLFPTLSDIMNRATVSFRMQGHSLEEVFEETHGHGRQSETTIYLFGISGIIIIALSFFVGLM
jgi:hypothetical protein